MRSKDEEVTMKKQIGSMLIESLVAMFLFTIGVLAIIKLESTLIKQGGVARTRVTASLLANELAGMANADNFNGACYVAPVANQTGCGSTVASGYTTNWVNEVTAALPNSIVSATLAADNTFVVTIQWKLQRDANYHNYVLVTNIGA